MTRETNIAEIAQIFLSATAQDCKDFREAVRDFVQDNLKTAKIFLQENWAEGGQFVVNVCEERVRSCDAYLGVFGHRYGWIPPGHTKSITALEFGWAVDKWRDKNEPPIFILLPEKGSEADKQLRDWAQPLIEMEFPHVTAQEAAALDQQKFLSSVIQWAADGRILVYYRDRTQLIGKALSSIQNWNLNLLRRALKGRRTAGGEIPDEELGRIGRNDQRTAMEHALEAFHDQKEERAVAFLIHGPESYGQREFTEFLYR